VWLPSVTHTKFSVAGFQLKNQDPVQVYSSAQYGAAGKLAVRDGHRMATRQALAFAVLPRCFPAPVFGKRNMRDRLSKLNKTDFRLISG
jgi:hypothetical protein